MRLLHSMPVRVLITVVTAACFEGSGSGFIGTNTDSGGVIGSISRLRDLSFFVQPGTTNVGQIITPPVQVMATDSTGATDSTFSGIVTVALTTNPAGAILGGTTQVRAVRGLASFGTLTIDRAGTYALRANAVGATAVSSQSFAIITPPR